MVLVGTALGGVLRNYLFEGIYIASPSMEPTLEVGLHLFLDKTAYLFSAPKRGDVIVFKSPVSPDKEMVKRVIAIAGDKIELRRKRVILNDVAQEEEYTQHTRTGEQLLGDNLGPLTVPAGTVFVLGDNRDESNDSSAWKDPESGERIPFIPLADVRGRLRGVY